MDILNFLNCAKDKSFWLKYSVFYFQGSEYQSLFINKLFFYLQDKGYIPFLYKRLSITSLDIGEFTQIIKQSVLGEYKIYFMGDVLSDTTEKNYKKTILILNNYTGPHILTFFLPEEIKFQSAYSLCIELPKEIDISTFEKINYFFEEKNYIIKHPIIKKIFLSDSSMSLDLLCMIIRYLELIGTRDLSECSEYVLNIIGQTPQLRMLSEYFFAYDANNFFKLWSVIEKNYSEMFWISFWAEHLWRACCVINYLNLGDFAQAKRAGFRLPYTFINRDWKKHNIIKLKKLYCLLYKIDYLYKTGSPFCLFEFFYLSHFLSNFFSYERG